MSLWKHNTLAYLTVVSFSGCISFLHGQTTEIGLPEPYSPICLQNHQEEVRLRTIGSWGQGARHCPGRDNNPASGQECFLNLIVHSRGSALLLQLSR